MNEFWTLYDPVKETQSEKLTTEEAQFVILRLKTKSIGEYLIMRNDWGQWQKLKAFLESPDSPFMSILPLTGNKPVEHPKAAKNHNQTIDFSNVKVEEVNIKDVFGSYGKEFNADHLKKKKNSPPTPVEPSNLDFKNFSKLTTVSSKRSNDSDFKIEMLLIHPKGEMFRGETSDISLTGTFCEKIIPNGFHQGTFDVMIINNLIHDDDFKRLTLKGELMVTDSRPYVKFVNLSDDQKNILRAGLDYYVRSIKKLQAKAS